MGLGMWGLVKAGLKLGGKAIGKKLLSSMMSQGDQFQKDDSTNTDDAEDVQPESRSDEARRKAMEDALDQALNLDFDEPETQSKEETDDGTT